MSDTHKLQNTSNWKKVPLRRISEVRTGVSKNSKRELVDPIEVPYLRVANVQDGHIDLSEVKYISLSKNDLPKFLLQRDDVLFTEGGDFDKLGRGHVWEGQMDPCVHQNHVFSVRVDKNKVIPHYLSVLAGSRHGKRYFVGCSKQTTNLASINSTQLKEFPVLLPSIEEQKEIVSILSSWDSAIVETQRLIEAKKQLKKGWMQQLLTGRRRFPEFGNAVLEVGVVPSGWRRCKLNQILKIRNSKESKSNSSQLYSLTIKDGITPKTERYNREKLVSDPKSKEYKVVLPHDIVYNPSNLRWGAIGKLDTNHKVLVSPIYEVLHLIDYNQYNIDFLYELLASKSMISRFSALGEGTLVERIAVKVKDFLSVEITVPKIDEQNKIATVLLTFNSEIERLKTLLVLLKNQKRGIIQKLLTSNVQVSKK